MPLTNFTPNTRAQSAQVDANFELLRTFIETGWAETREEFIYVSSDDPVYVAKVSGDATDKYSAGMRIMLTDSGVQYFIIHKVELNGSDTELTLFGGTSHTQGELSGGAITSPYFSTMKAPQGFSLNDDDWMVETSDASDRDQATPTQNTWYNLGSVSIIIPIGCWKTRYDVSGYLYDASQTGNIALDMETTLSTTTNTETDNDFTCKFRAKYYISGSATTFQNHFSRKKIIDIATKDTYYLNGNCIEANISEMQFLGSSAYPTIIRAVSDYL